MSASQSSVGSTLDGVMIDAHDRLYVRRSRIFRIYQSDATAEQANLSDPFVRCERQATVPVARSFIAFIEVIKFGDFDDARNLAHCFKCNTVPRLIQRGSNLEGWPWVPVKPIRALVQPGIFP